jgi:hypothetical protein
MPTPAVTRAPRSHPDHLDEHTRLAQVTDWDRPRGIIAYKMGTLTSQPLSSTQVTAFSLTNVAVKARRLYLISWAIRAHASGTSAGYMRSLFYWGGSLIDGWHDYLQANASWQHHVAAALMPIITDVTVTVEIKLDSATTTGTYWTDRGGHLKIEDIGPDRGKQ